MVAPVLACAVASLAGCKPPSPASGFEAGRDLARPMEGQPDAGPVVTFSPPDGGPIFRADQAGEPCPDEVFVSIPEPEDGGAPPQAVNTFGICVVLKKFGGVMRLNDQPVTAPVSLRFSAAAWGSEFTRTPDRNGYLQTRVMRGRYDVFEYEPDGVFATHEGPALAGLIDMTRDQTRDLGVRSYPVRGTARFGNLPFIAQTLPPDVQIASIGDPPSQRVTATSLGGAYEVALMEGIQGIYVSAPPAALGGTELIRHQVTSSVVINRPTNVDIDIPARQLSGTILLDGQPLPDRVPGADFQFEYTPNGATDPAVRSYHLGGVAEYAALVPEAKYQISLRVEGAPSSTYPSRVYNVSLASGVDLRFGNQQRNFDLRTVNVEASLAVDGVAVPPNPGASWSMYMFGYSTADKPGSLIYFDVPLDGSGYQLRTFPDLYYTAVLVNAEIAPQIAGGWYRVDRYFDARNSTTLPINIQTSWLEGKLKIDGRPPPQGKPAGTLWFKAREATFLAPITTAEDGSFRVRVAKGAYELAFKTDLETYPDYASGFVTVLPRIDLNESQTVDLSYETRVLSGPLRVGGEVVPDAIPGEEVSLYFLSSQNVDFTWPFQGGTPNYRVRIPKGEYSIRVTLNEGVFSDVAHGDAPLGTKVQVFPAQVPASTGRQ